MLGLQVLDLLIGLVLVFLVFSIASSAFAELIEARLKVRSKDLKLGIERLLGQPATPAPGAAASRAAGVPAPVNYTDRLLNHPLITSLARKAGGLPSYIPSRTFTTALLAVVKTRDGPLSIEAVRESIGQLPVDSRLRAALEALIDDTVANLEAAQTKVEAWFDDAMDRVAGWYKRRTQVVLFVIGLSLAVLANADSVTIANTLWQNPTIREETVALAKNVTPGSIGDVKPEALQDNLTSLNLLGWSEAGPRNLPDDAEGWLAKIIGLFVTAAAVTQGAPFWFDIMKKLVNLRAAGEPPKKSVAPEIVAARA